MFTKNMEQTLIKKVSIVCIFMFLYVSLCVHSM